VGILDEMKEIGDLIKKAGDIDLYRRINKLEGEVIDLTRDKRRADEKIEELERTLKFKAELVFKEPFYWLGADQTPYCPVCWESEHKAVHIHFNNSHNAIQYWVCLNCEAQFSARGLPMRG
jgi:hypothetical protein